MSKLPFALNRTCGRRNVGENSGSVSIVTSGSEHLFFIHSLFSLWPSFTPHLCHLHQHRYHRMTHATALSWQNAVSYPCAISPVRCQLNNGRLDCNSLKASVMERYLAGLGLFTQTCPAVLSCRCFCSSLPLLVRKVDQVRHPRLPSNFQDTWWKFSLSITPYTGQKRVWVMTLYVKRIVPNLIVRVTKETKRVCM